MIFKKSQPLKKPADIDHGYDYALFLLDLRMRTEAEMREKMLARGYYPEVIDAVVKRLFEDRYLNDEHYAEVYIESMKNYKYYGSFMMKKKLLEKKVPKNIVETKLLELVTESDEQEIATRYVEKEFGKIKDVKQMEYLIKQKIMRRLLSRGFSLNVVKGLVE